MARASVKVTRVTKRVRKGTNSTKNTSSSQRRCPTCGKAR